jgi:hypothetical protein
LPKKASGVVFWIRKKMGVVGHGIFLFLLGFSRVFWKKWVVDGGFLLVRSWWMGGETWCVAGRFLTTKNTPRF